MYRGLTFLTDFKLYIKRVLNYFPYLKRHQTYLLQSLPLLPPPPVIHRFKRDPFFGYVSVIMSLISFAAVVICWIWYFYKKYNETPASLDPQVEELKTFKEENDERLKEIYKILLELKYQIASVPENGINRPISNPAPRPRTLYSSVSKHLKNEDFSNSENAVNLNGSFQEVLQLFEGQINSRSTLTDTVGLAGDGDHLVTSFDDKEMLTALQSGENEMDAKYQKTNSRMEQNPNILNPEILGNEKSSMVEDNQSNLILKILRRFYGKISAIFCSLRLINERPNVVLVVEPPFSHSEGDPFLRRVCQIICQGAEISVNWVHSKKYIETLASLNPQVEEFKIFKKETDERLKEICKILFEFKHQKPSAPGNLINHNTNSRTECLESSWMRSSEMNEFLFLESKVDSKRNVADEQKGVEKCEMCLRLKEALLYIQQQIDCKSITEHFPAEAKVLQCRKCSEEENTFGVNSTLEGNMRNLLSSYVQKNLKWDCESPESARKTSESSNVSSSQKALSVELLFNEDIGLSESGVEVK